MRRRPVRWRSWVPCGVLLSCGVLSCVWLSCGGEDPPPSRAISGLPAEAGPLDALNRRHARLRQRLRLRGYEEESGLSRSFVLESHGVALPLDLGVGRCSTFLALAGGSIREMTLTLYDGEGEQAATDSVAGEGGLVHVCPQAEAGVSVRPYHLVLRAIEGAGAIMVAHFESDPEAGDGFDGLFEGVLAPRVPFRDVEEHLARSRRALRARGFSPLSQPVLDRMTEGDVVRVPASLEAGRCYVAMGRSGEGLRDIDLFLFDGAGAEVARDLAADAEPSIEHCPDEAGRYTVELRAFEGAGAVGVMLFVGPDARSAEANGATLDASHDDRGAVSDDPSLALGVLAAPLLSRGFSAPVFVSRDAAIVPGEVRTHDVVVGPGCALIAGTASHEGLDLDLYLSDSGGREIDRDTAVQSTARVRACRAAASVLTVAVKGYGRDGAYALAILRAPAAVSTLLDLRLEEAMAPYRLRGYQERGGFEAELGAGERVRREIIAEAGRCLAVAAAGDDGALDVDLYLRDPAGELVVSESGPAPHATASRCAEEREVLTVDVLLSRGQGNVAVRVLSWVADGPEQVGPPLPAPIRPGASRPSPTDPPSSSSEPEESEPSSESHSSEGSTDVVEAEAGGDIDAIAPLE